MKFADAFAIALRKYGRFIPDEPYIKIQYKLALGAIPNLRAPESFNEKLQWLKLHDRNPEYILLVDKINVKKWIAERIGANYVPATYAVWDGVGEITLSGLPNKFVIKTNHDCGGVVVCNHSDNFDLDSAKSIIDRHLKRNYFWGCREWPYKHVKPKVFAEELLLPSNGDCSLSDYKFFCFDGDVDCVMVCTERETGNPKFLFFDDEWNLLPYNLRSASYAGETACFKPQSLNDMWEIAKTLSKGFPFLRVDMYSTRKGIVVGELTLYPQGGFDPNILPGANERWGRKIDLGKSFSSETREEK